MSAGSNIVRSAEHAPPPEIAELRSTALARTDEVDEYFTAGARVAPGDVVVDVGANVGAFAMRVAERTGGAVTIHCFEPAPPTFDVLRANVAAHPMLRRATSTTSCVALTRSEDAGRTRPFYHFARMPTNSTYDLDDKRAEHEAYFAALAARLEARLARVPLAGPPLGRLVRWTIESICRRGSPLGVWLSDRVSGLRVLTCETESLERWMEAHEVPRIDLLKVDVEGAELDVLLGCGAKWPAIRSVAIETNERGGRAEAIVALLQARGFAAIRRARPRSTEDAGLDNVLVVAHRDAP